MDQIQHGAIEEDGNGHGQGQNNEIKGAERANRADSTQGRGYANEARSKINGKPSSGEYDSDDSIQSMWYKYTHEANHGNGSRRRRATKSEPRNPKKTCSLFIQTDPLLWKHIHEAEKGNPENTRKEITSLIAQHVKAVNTIYMDAKFDGKYLHRRTRFEVQRIKIDDHEACESNYRGEENKFCLPNIDVSNFLNLHSQGDHEAFCLAYVFTYRYLCTSCVSWLK